MADPKYRPAEDERCHRDRTEPVTFEVHTTWLYSEPRPEDSRFGKPRECSDCGSVHRHAFGRGGAVTASDVPSKYDHQQDMASHLWRAIEKFGDDQDLVIEIRPKEA